MSSNTLVTRTGVTGWDFPHWDGLVYPTGLARRVHPLEFLADRVDCVEIPTTFRQPIRPELAHLWATRVRHNPHFRFTATAPRDFTHERNLDPARLEAFRAGLAPLHDARLLGCVVMQFPFSFRFTAENKEYLIRLRRALHAFPLAAELRHDSWMAPEGMGTLIDYHIGFVNLDQPERMRAAPPSSTLTTGIGYVKLHGRHCGPDHFAFETSARKTTGNDYLYTTAELESWKERIARLERFANQVFVMFNNDGGGKAVVNALQMQSILGSQPEAKTPRNLARAHRPALVNQLGLKQNSLFAPAA